MKRSVLFLVIFVFTPLFVISQSSFQERLKVRNTDTTEKMDIQIFPNPVTTYFGLSSNIKVIRVIIFNLVGHEMKRFEFVDGEKYYVGDLPKGMYLVQLMGRENEVLKTQRVSKR